MEKGGVEDLKPKFSVWKVIRKISSNSFNVMNNIVGAGILFLPYLLRQMGIVLGIGYLIFGFVINFFFQELTHQSLNKAREQIDEHNSKENDGKKKLRYISTIEGLSSHVFPGIVGKLSFWILKILVILLLAGILTAYQIVLNSMALTSLNRIYEYFNNGDVLVVQDSGSDDFDFWIDFRARGLVGLAIFLLLFILCFFGKEIRRLAFVNYLGLFSTVVFFVTALILFLIGFTNEKKEGQIVYFPPMDKPMTYINMFSNLGVVIFAYACAMIYSLHGDVKKTKNLYTVELSIFNSLVIVCFTYVSIAVVGYFSFFDSTAPNIILSYKGDNVAAVIVTTLLRTIIFMQLVLTYPTTHYALTVTVDEAVLNLGELLKKKKTTLVELERETPKKSPLEKKQIKIDEVVPEKEEQKKEEVDTVVKKKKIITPKWIRQSLITLLVCLFLYFVAVIYPKAINVIGYIGSTVLIMYFFIFPTVFFIILRKDVSIFLRVLLLLFSLFCTLLLGVVPTILSLLGDFGVYGDLGWV